MVLKPHLQGVGGTTWIFEIPKNRLIILSFYWGVRPNAIPEIDNEYKRAMNKSNLALNANVTYKTYSNNDETWVHLSGYIDSNSKVDIKRKYHVTNIKDTDFIELLP